MEHYMPEIFWHDRKALLSVAFRNSKDAVGVYKIVTTSVQKEVRIWNFKFVKEGDATGRDALAVDFVANLQGHSGVVNVARFSPDGEVLASGDCEGQVFLWKIGPETSSASVLDSSQDDFPPNKENWVRMRAPLRHDSDVCALCWSPDSQFLATVSNDESVVVYNIKTGSRLWALRNFRHFPNGVVWDPRGKYIVTMSTDRKLDVLDAAKGTRLRCIWSVHMKAGTLCGVDMQEESYKLFHDDQMISFARGPDFTPDGELLIVPCAHLEIGGCNVYGTYIFRRCDFDKDRPHAFLPSAKPTFRVACSPVLLQLRDDVQGNALGLPYRLVWAVLTRDSVTVYDSQSYSPVAYLDNIHYNTLTDLAWSADGKILLVSSLEGYCSFIRFAPSSVGEVVEKACTPPPSPQLIVPRKAPKRTVKTDAVVAESEVKPAASAEAPKSSMTPLRVRGEPTTASSPKPKNTLFKYLARSDKSPSVERKGESKPSSDEARTPSVNSTEKGDKREGEATSTTTAPQAPKAKKRVQLQSIPLVTLD